MMGLEHLEEKELPQEKYEEALEKVNGRIEHCRKCGVLTAYIGEEGEVSECHNCSNVEQI